MAFAAGPGTVCIDENGPSATVFDAGAADDAASAVELGVGGQAFDANATSLLHAIADAAQLSA